MELVDTSRSTGDAAGYTMRVSPATPNQGALESCIVRDSDGLMILALYHQAPSYATPEYRALQDRFGHHWNPSGGWGWAPA